MNKYIRRIAVSLLSLVCFVACKEREDGEISETRKLLNDVQTYMMESPDSALVVLRGMNIHNDDYWQMLMHYAQGCAQSASEDYPAAIISLFNAEKNSEGIKQSICFRTDIPLCFWNIRKDLQLHRAAELCPDGIRLLCFIW